MWIRNVRSRLSVSLAAAYTAVMVVALGGCGMPPGGDQPPGQDLCMTDADCDDGDFCTSGDRCDTATGACIFGSDPCAAGEVCDEENDVCQPDADGDTIGDSTDNCPGAANVNQADADGDGAGDVCDQCPNDADDDADDDGLCGDVDNCPGTPNVDQADTNGDGVGDACEGDQDGDGVPDENDNCPAVSNANQADADLDGAGDACDVCPNDADDDEDADGVCGDVDDCPNTPPRTDVDASGCEVTAPPPPPPPPPPSTCGDGTVDPGEGCDDGNTTPGDGCDDECRQELPLSDSCTAPATVTEGGAVYSNVGATTDGPDEPTACNFFSETQIGADVWFCYTASCNGPVVASLCGSDYDTKMAVYVGCDCPTTTPLVCSDDDCGASAVTSRVTFAAQSGQDYMIRVGGFPDPATQVGDQGTGLFNILCDPQVCGTGNGDCNADNGSRGCDDAECCNTTCDVDPFCCDVEWDGVCASESPGLCSGSFAECGGVDAGDCFVDAGNGTPGCDDEACCNRVCGVDPFCCIDTWDDICADQAVTCTCGDVDSGDCSIANQTPGCSTESCCELVCETDSFCCSERWDEDCATAAANLCSP